MPLIISYCTVDLFSYNARLEAGLLTTLSAILVLLVKREKQVSDTGEGHNESSESQSTLSAVSEEIKAVGKTTVSPVGT